MIARFFDSKIVRIFRRISLRVLPSRRTTRWCRLMIAPSLAVVFSVSAESNSIFFNVHPRSFYQFCIIVVYIPSIPDPVEELALQGPRVSSVFHTGFRLSFRDASIGIPIQVLSPTLLRVKNHRVLYFIPSFLDIEKVVDVSKQLHILISAISGNLERPPSSVRCKLILRRSLRQRNQ